MMHEMIPIIYKQPPKWAKIYSRPGMQESVMNAHEGNHDNRTFIGETHQRRNNHHSDAFGYDIKWMGITIE